MIFLTLQTNEPILINPRHLTMVYPVQTPNEPGCRLLFVGSDDPLVVKQTFEEVCALLPSQDLPS